MKPKHNHHRHTDIRRCLIFAMRERDVDQVIAIHKWAVNNRIADEIWAAARIASVTARWINRHVCYHVTGVDRSGRRFKIITRNAVHAEGINVYRGSKWLVVDGKRTLLHRVYN